MVHFNPNIYQATPTFWGRLANIFSLLWVPSHGDHGDHGEAVLIFLSWVGFMLMGAYLFLGSEALIPQLTANVSAVGGAVTLIRSKSRHGAKWGVSRCKWENGMFFSPKNCACRSCSHLESHGYQVRKERIVKV